MKPVLWLYPISTGVSSGARAITRLARIDDAYRWILGFLIAITVAACGYDASVRDCTIRCSTASGCPDGFSCSPSEGLCQAAGVSMSCYDARQCTGGDASMTAPDGSCLLLFVTPKTYVDAKADCLLLGAHLAKLDSEQLDTFAESFVGNRDTFIGLSDLASENTFVWDDGTPATFASWRTGEPNNGGGGAYQEDCTVIAGSTGQQWDDRPCMPMPNAGGGLYAYLCQF